MSNQAQHSQPLWRNKPFVNLMAAQAVSNVGDWLDLLALITLVAWKWHATSVEMSAVILCFAAPLVVLGPFAGVLADRLDRRALMMVSDLVRAVLVLGFVWVTALWQVYLLLVLKGALEALFTPAKNGKLKEIIPDERMEQATTVSTLIDHGAKVFGPVLGGVFVGAFGIVSAFYADAASFLLSALLLIGVPGGSGGVTAELQRPETSFMLELQEGLGFIRKVPLLWYGLIVFSAAMLIVQVADSQLMILFREAGLTSTGAVGTAMAASGVGLAVSVGLLGRRSIRRPLAVMAVGTVGLGLVYAAAGLAVCSPDAAAWAIPLLFFLGGMAAGLVMVPFQSGAQKRTPVELSGRVFGVVNSVVTAMVIVGPMLGAAAVTLYGVVPAFAGTGGALAVIGGAVWLLRHAIERRDRHVTESNGGTQGTATA